MFCVRSALSEASNWTCIQKVTNSCVIDLGNSCTLCNIGLCLFLNIMQLHVPPNLGHLSFLLIICLSVYSTTTCPQYLFIHLSLSCLFFFFISTVNTWKCQRLHLAHLFSLFVDLFSFSPTYRICSFSPLFMGFVCCLWDLSFLF